MTIDHDCPVKSNIELADAELVDEIMADFPPLTAAESEQAACFATELTHADMEELARFDSPALSAVEVEQDRRREEIAARSAKQARDDYALEKKARTGEAPRAYQPTGIGPRHHANGHFQFETEEEYRLRYDRELKRLRRPKPKPKLTDDERKERKRISNAKRQAR